MIHELAASTSFRWSVYSVLMVIAAGGMTGRILTVKSDRGGTPFLSANDRSRWATIRALVDEGTYAIDNVTTIVNRSGKLDRDPEWHTIDRVRHKDRNGQWRFYSSKPPLLPTLLAGKYWVLKQLTGRTLAEQPFYIGRTMLVTTNVLPMLLLLFLLALTAERFGTTDWGSLFVLAAGAAGTFLTTFAVTLNNHLPAAVSVMVAAYAALRIWYDDRRHWGWFLLAGLAAGFAATNELPALAFLAAIGAALAARSLRQTLLAFAPAAALVLAAQLGLNYLAHNSFIPPYAHWSDGPRLAAADAAWADELNAGRVPPGFREELLAQGASLSEALSVEPSPTIDKRTGLPRKRWVLFDAQANDYFALVPDAEKIHLHAWNNWYDFPGSYWTQRPSGIDRGEPSRLVYLVNVLIGHHGIFSLTPVWLLSLAGVVMLLRRGGQPLRAFALMVAAISIVVVAFYISRPLLQRNYGGMTCGLRWAFWMIPLWLVVMLPAADWIARRPRWQALALALLLVSVMSASYASLNPWRHPWLYDYWAFIGWVQP